jgi:hypothetical protein
VPGGAGSTADGVLAGARVDEVDDVGVLVVLVVVPVLPSAGTGAGDVVVLSEGDVVEVEVVSWAPAPAGSSVASTIATTGTIAAPLRSALSRPARRARLSH